MSTQSIEKPLPVPDGMTDDEMEAMTTSDGEWRMSHRYVHVGCGEPAYYHPYTNQIWGCKSCGFTTRSVGFYFEDPSGADDLPF